MDKPPGWCHWNGRGGGGGEKGGVLETEGEKRGLKR